MARTVVHEGLEAKWGDKDHLEVAQNKTFSEMIFELLSEREPKPEEAKLWDLVLNLSIDHGPDAPSTAATIAAAKEGKDFGESVGAGVSEINERHGGAVEPLMNIIYGVKNETIIPSELVKDYLENDKRLPGFGHRIYKDTDPRAELIFEKMAEARVGEEYIKIVKDLREALNSQSGKSLPINIDGAIAALLCGFGWESRLGKSVYIIARTPGLCGHYINTVLTSKP